MSGGGLQRRVRTANAFFLGWSLSFHPILKVSFLKRAGSACLFLIGLSAPSLWWTSLVWPFLQASVPTGLLGPGSASF